MASQVAALAARLRIHEAKDAMRATLMRYMDLCDVPGPLTDLDQIAELFTPRAIWEGVGPEYEGKFGRITGRRKIAEMVGGYLPPHEHFQRNAHLVGSEQLSVTADRGQGQWLMQQLSTYHPSLRQPDDLLCARLRIDFDLTHHAEPASDGAWCTARIRHFRTQRLFAAPLGPAS